MDILDEIGISDSEPTKVTTSYKPEFNKVSKPNSGKVNMYDVEFIKSKEIDTDSFEKTGHTFMVHVYPGDDDISLIEEQLLKVSSKLTDKGYVYRCDAGIDDKLAMRVAKIEGIKREVYLPFKKFNENLADGAILTNPYEKPYQYAAHIYGQRYNDLKKGAKAVYAAKLMTALGVDSNNPVDFLLCYSPDGREHLSGKEKIDYKKLGSLSFYLKICQSSGIPVYNFKNKDSIVNFVENYLKSTNED